MTIAWTPLWKRLFSSRVVPIIVRQNYRLLEIVGEPVYLLIRIRKRDIMDEGVIEKNFNTQNLISLDNFAVLKLWQYGDNIMEYPDTRSLKIFKDDIEMTDVVLKDFITDENMYAVEVIKNNIELNIQHEVRIIFHKNLLNQSNNFRVEYFRIATAFDRVYYQSDSHETKLSLYGWKQPNWRGCYFRDKLIRGAFLVAFPDLSRDLNIESTGMVPTSDYELWTSPPPLSPIITEHDVIVRLNGLRYEVRNFTRNIIQNILVQQEFRVSEIEPSNPIYDIPVDTVKGELKGFPVQIYSGA